MVLTIAAVYGSNNAAAAEYHTAPQHPIATPIIGKYATERIRKVGWWSARDPHGSLVRNITAVKNVRISDASSLFGS